MRIAICTACGRLKSGTMSKKISMWILLLVLCTGCGRTADTEKDHNNSLAEAAEETLTEENIRIKTVWTGKEENIDKAVIENQAASVQVMAGDEQGSGVLWDVRDEKLIVATAAHVLAETGTGKLLFSDGCEAEFELLHQDAEKDIAFLQTDLSAVPDETCEKIRLVSRPESCYQKLKAGAEIGLVGMDGGMPVTSTGTVIEKSWYVADFPMEMIYMKCYAQPGMSGCGIFDVHGHLLGLLDGGNGEESVGIPVSVVEEMYHLL